MKLSAYITGVLIVDEEYVEVDAIEIYEDIHVVPRSHYYGMEESEVELDRSASEYFCLSDGRLLQDNQDISLWEPKSEETAGINHNFYLIGCT